MPTKTQVRHVHIGAGQLGLGLVCDLSFDKHFSLTIINRASGGSPARAFLRRGTFSLRKANGDLKTIEGFTYREYDTKDYSDKASQEALAAIRNADVITVSIGMKNSSDLEELSSFLYAGLNRRDDENPILLLAFENFPRNSSKLQELILEKHKQDHVDSGWMNIVPVDTIVDRVCVLDGSDVTGETVWVEDDAEIVLFDPSGSAANLFESGGDELRIDGKTLRFVRQREIFEALEFRKIFGVNASHLALVAIADFLRQENLASCLQTSEGAVRFLRGCQREIVAFLLKKFSETNVVSPLFVHDAMMAYCEKVIVRFKNNPWDTITRILNDLHQLEELGGKSGLKACTSRLSSLKGIQQKLNTRLGEPVRTLGWNKTDIEPKYLGLALAQLVDRVNEHLQTYA